MQLPLSIDLRKMIAKSIILLHGQGNMLYLHYISDRASHNVDAGDVVLDHELIIENKNNVRHTLEALDLDLISCISNVRLYSFMFLRISCNNKTSVLLGMRTQ